MGNLSIGLSNTCEIPKCNNPSGNLSSDWLKSHPVYNFIKPFGKSSEKPSGHSSRWQDEKPSSDMPPRRKKKPASFSDGGSSEHRSRRGEANTDAKPFHAKPKSHKPSSRPHAKSGMKAGGKSGANFANKSGAKPGNKSGGSATLKRKR